jgi:hypothetical protein
LRGLLAPGGWLALADLDDEDGSFHSDPAEVHHHGIDRGWLCTELTALGFAAPTAVTAHTFTRPDADGLPRDYPIFLVSARLPQ